MELNEAVAILAAAGHEEAMQHATILTTDRVGNITVREAGAIQNEQAKSTPSKQAKKKSKCGLVTSLCLWQSEN
jgi:hypothetical protein